MHSRVVRGRAAASDVPCRGTLLDVVVVVARSAVLRELTSDSQATALAAGLWH